MLSLAKGSLVWFLNLLHLTAVWEMGTSLFLQKWSSVHETGSRKDGLGGEQGLRELLVRAVRLFSAITLLTFFSVLPSFKVRILLL